MKDWGSPQFRSLGDVHKALHPLQSTATRVGRQVEKFAETLDRLSSLKRKKHQGDRAKVLELVREYERIAADAVKRLKRGQEVERQEVFKASRQQSEQRPYSPGLTLDRRSSRGGSTEDISTSSQDLEYWQQEHQTWILLRLMLQTQYTQPAMGAGPSVEEEPHYARPREGLKPHRFSSEDVVWRDFLARNDDAWEKNLVVEWLKSSADSTGQDIDTLIEQLEKESGIEEDQVSYGWICSREAIKAQKRLRSWPQAIELSNSGINATLVTSDRSSDLITQLDPDCPLRQGRELEKEDLLFEQTTWLACWEMIRRGRSWDSICEWCEERMEGWKALSLRGNMRMKSHDGKDPAPMSMMDWRARSLWQKACLKAARGGGVNPYEKAVYGALSGDLDSVLQIAKTWDDRLFALYNSELLQGFDFFIQSSTLKRTLRLDDSGLASDISTAIQPPQTTGLQAWRQLLEDLEQEARTPLKMLQGSLISKTFPTYISDQGLRLGRDQLGAEKRIQRRLRLTPAGTTPQGPTAKITFEDHNILRILTHIILVFQELERSERKARRFDVPTENIIFAYVNWLGKAGKQQLLPLYASKLSRKGSVECMARQIPYIVDVAERQTVMSLMKHYRMDIVEILRAHLWLITSDQEASAAAPFPSAQLRILDSAKDAAGLPRIRTHILDGEIGADAQDLVNGLEWFLLLEDRWNDTMWAGSLVYKHLLRAGELAAAKIVASTISFERVWRRKAPAVLGDKAVFSPGQYAEDKEIDERRLNAEERQQRMKRETLLKNSRTFRDLENLVVALDALDDWTYVAYGRDASKEDLRRAAEWKARLKSAQDAVIESFEPILSGWLEQPENELEEIELRQLRRDLIPDLVLAYATVLNFGGRFVSREVLLRCMELGASVAAQGSELAACFVEAGRMAELVQTMGFVSKSLLQAGEHGSSRRGKRGGAGGDVELWNPRIRVADD